jgi:hypothetical protein
MTPSVRESGADHDEPSKVTTLPSWSTAAQNSEVAHETAEMDDDPSTFRGADQFVAAAATFGVVAAAIKAVAAMKRRATPTLTTLPPVKARDPFE